jgi:hypothetical protein
MSKSLADQKLFSLLCELHQACRQHMRYNGVDADRTFKAYKRLTEATHAVTLHLERQLDEETEDA